MASEKGLVTFDFDNTLTVPYWTEGGYWEYTDTPNEEMIQKMRDYAAKGHRIAIVTARSRVEDGFMPCRVPDFVKEHNLPVDEIHYTGGARKGSTLKDLGSTLHHDDRTHELESCKKHGIPHERVHYPDPELGEASDVPRDEEEEDYINWEDEP